MEEMKKLQQEHKRALKSTRRELKKDAQFMANVRFEEQKSHLAERKQKIREAMAWLQGAAHEAKMEDREKAKAKAKDKRKRGK